MARRVDERGCRRRSAAPAPSRARRPAPRAARRSTPRRVARPRGRQRDARRGRRARRRRARGGVASPRASACSPSSSVDEPAVLRQRVLDHLRALRDRHLGVAAERRQVGLHARQRRAQLVPGVGGEAPRRRQRALAVGRRAPEPREHLVEARRQRAQLGRPVVAGHAAVEVLGAGDAGGRPAQAAQRAQRHVGGEPGAQRRQEQRGRAERQQAAVELGQLALGRRQPRRDLQPREPAERLQADRVGAVTLAAGLERVQAVARRRPPGRRRAAEGRQLAPVEQQPQRRAGGRQDVVQALVARGQLALAPPTAPSRARARRVLFRRSSSASRSERST